MVPAAYEEKGAGGGRGRPARDGRPRPRPAAERHHHPRGARERHRRDRHERRLDERRPAPARGRARGRASSSTSTTSTASRPRRRCCATSSPAAATSPATCTTPAGWPSWSSASLEAGLLHEDAETVTGQTIGEHARSAQETEGQRGRAAPRRRDQAHRRPGDPARQPRARGQRRQALRPRARPPRGPRPRVRVRGGRDGRRHRAVDQGGRRGRDPQRGARRRARACARCSPSRRRSWARGWGRRSRCSRTAASPAPRTGSWPATSRPRRSPAARSPRSTTATRSPSTCRTAGSTSTSPTTRSRARVAAYDAPASVTDGVLGKYAKLVSSASEGAVTR